MKKEKKSLKKVNNDNDNNDNNNDNNLDSFDYLVELNDYVQLEKNIPKYDEITYDNVNNIINSGLEIVLLGKLLIAISNTGYKMQKGNYMNIIKFTNKRYYYDRLNKFAKIFKNFAIDDDSIEEWCDFFDQNNIYHINFNYETFLNTNDKKTLENFFYLLCHLKGTNNSIIKNYLDYAQIHVTEKCLKYVKIAETKKYIYKIMSKSVSEPTKIIKKENDEKLLQCKTVSKLEDFIAKYDYEVSATTIIMACQNNVNKDILNHLFSYKLNFSEIDVNEIIRSYRDNDNIENILLSLRQYGYQFKKSNYIEILSSKHYHKLFNNTILDNFILDDEMLDMSFNAYKRYPDQFNEYLSRIEHLGKQNKTTAEGIIALYCSIGNDTKVKELTQKYNIKLTEKCLVYLYKNRYNASKKMIELFKNDNVKPNYDALLQYIDTYYQRQEHLNELLDKN